MGEAVWLFGWLVGAQTRRNGLIHGGAVYTYAQLHKRTGYKARTIETWLKRLTEKGYVAVEHTNFKMMRIRILNQKKYKTKQSSLDFSYPVGQRDMTSPPSLQPTGAVPVSQRDTARQPAGSNKNLSMSSTETPERESIALPGFDRFYAEYPRKIGFYRARVEWVKSPLLERHIDEIMAGLAPWIISQQWQDEQFIPYPANFIRDRGWEDTPPKENANGTSKNNSRARNAIDSERTAEARRDGIVL